MTDNWWMMGQIAEARMEDLRREAAGVRRLGDARGVPVAGSRPSRWREAPLAWRRRLGSHLVSLGRALMA
jgi:hypothetical protein